VFPSLSSKGRDVAQRRRDVTSGRRTACQLPSGAAEKRIHGVDDPYILAGERGDGPAVFILAKCAVDAGRGCHCEERSDAAIPLKCAASRELASLRSSQ